MNMHVGRLFVLAVLVPCAGAQSGLGPASTNKQEAVLAPEALVKRASKFMDAGSYRYAVGDLNRALRADPSNAKALALRGTAWAKLQETDKALADLDHAIQISPADPDLYAARAEAREGAGRLSDSKVDRQAAERLRTGGSVVTAPAEAKEAAKTEPAQMASAPITAALIEGDPMPATPANAAVRFASPPVQAAPEIKRPPKEPAQIKPAEIKPLLTKQTAESAATHNQRARVLIGQNKLTEAIAELNQAVGLEPSGSIHYNTRGYAYLLMHDAKHALTDLDKAIQLNQNYLNAYTNRSAARKLAGDKAGSAADAKQALFLSSVIE